MSTHPIPQSNTPSTADRPADDVNPTRGVAVLATEPALIPGIYQMCDQWCMYCRATDQCLAFRSTNARDVNGVFDPVGDADDERVGGGLALLKVLADAEGHALAPEVEALVLGDRDRQRAVFTLDDPLERLGRSYMSLAEAYLRSRSDFPPRLVWRDAGPTPIEQLTWYHVLAPARVFRAILCAAEAARGVAGRHRDTLSAAKVALIGIDRSMTALTAIRGEDDDPRLELLEGRLQRLRDGVEDRFPDARQFIRPGLDEDVGPRRDGEGGCLARCRRWLGGIRALLHWRDEWSAVGPASRDVRGSARGAGAPRG
jgi:hypothetical protein